MDKKIPGEVERLREEVAQRERLNRRIEAGVAQLDRSEGIEGEQAFRNLWEKSRQRRGAR
jgi:hypothetical protein